MQQGCTCKPMFESKVLKQVTLDVSSLGHHLVYFDEAVELVLLLLRVTWLQLWYAALVAAYADLGVVLKLGTTAHQALE